MTESENCTQDSCNQNDSCCGGIGCWGWILIAALLVGIVVIGYLMLV